MATRCHIGYTENNITFRATYSHWDGYPQGVLKRAIEIIKKNGFDGFKEIIERGIRGGGISSWDLCRDEIKFYDEPKNEYLVTQSDQMNEDYGYVLNKDGELIIATYWGEPVDADTITAQSQQN